MRHWFIVLVILTLAGVSPALAIDPVQISVDPADTLKGSALLDKTVPLDSKGWGVSELDNGPDLDLGFNDYMDIKLKTDAGTKSAIDVGFDVTKTPTLSGARIAVIPADKLVRDGAWHTYRLDLALHMMWRGQLSGLTVMPSGEGKDSFKGELGSITVGDIPGTDFVPDYREYKKSDYELSSKHFRFIWNEARATSGMTPEWAHGNLRNAEECWALYMKAFGMNEPTNKNESGQKYLVNFTCIDQGFFAGGGRLNIDPSGLRVDPPTWVTPHEFRHMCQFFSSTGEGGAPQDMYESDANYTRECWLWYYGPTYDPTSPKTTVEYFNLLNYTIPHGRTYYIDWPFMVYMNENPDNMAGLGGQFWWRVWADGKQGEYFWDTVQRLAPQAPRKDILGHVAQRRSFAYSHRYPTDNSERTELRVTADNPGWWQVPSEMAPMQAGFTIHELVLAPGNRTVSVDFRGLPDKERTADWRASLVAISDDGTERYSKLWNAGSQSITLGPKENKLLLVVAGTPDKMLPTQFDDTQSPYRTDPGKARFPYEVKMTGATPKQSSPNIGGGFHKHANGGGRVSDSAQVDATAYVGPNAVVAGNAQVRGKARIQDYALVTDSAQVNDTAVVSGHAVVSGRSVVRDHGKVRDYAQVRNSTVSGNGRVLEHAVLRDNAVVKDNATAKGRAEVWGADGSTVGGDGEADGDHCGGQTITNGFHYGHQPYVGDPWVEGRKAPARILGQYDFDKAQESLLQDGFGSSYGIIRGKPVWVEKDGEHTGVLKLTGKDYVVLDRQLVDEPAFTIGAWVRWDGGAANQPLWFFGAGDKQCMWLTPSDSKGRVAFTARLAGKTETAVGKTALPKGQWVYVAVSGQGIFVNGKLVAPATLTIKPEEVLPANLNDVAQPFYIGRGFASTQPYFRGSIDRISFFSKSMSAAEVTTCMTTPAPDTFRAAPQPRRPRRQRPQS